MMMIMFEAVPESACVCMRVCVCVCEYICVCALEVCVFAWPTLSRGGLQHVGSCIVCRVLTLPPAPTPLFTLLSNQTNCSYNCANDQRRRVRTSPDKSEHANEPSKKKPKRANKISATELIKKL